MDAQHAEDRTGRRGLPRRRRRRAPGHLRQQGGRWRISSRGFNDVDGPVGPSRIEVALSGGRVASVRDAGAQAARSSRRGWIRRASPRCMARSRKNAGWCGSRKCPSCWSPACRRSRTATSTTTTASTCQRHAARGLGRPCARRRDQAGRQHADPAAGAQRPARHRPEQTVTRKFKEILYALLIEARYDKRTILEAYLNQVYLGQRGAQAIHGVAAGAEFWFGRDLRDLSTEQVALLVGIVRGPSYYDPRRNPGARAGAPQLRPGEVHETGLIDDAEFAARAEGAARRHRRKPGSSPPTASRPTSTWSAASSRATIPADALQGAGLSVMTGMSPVGAGLCRRRGDRDAKALEQQEAPAAAGRPGRHRRARRRSAGGGRQPRASRARLQPRGRGAASGRFAAQAVRVPAGAGAARTASRWPAGSTTPRSPSRWATASAGARAIPTAAATAACA